MKISSLKTRTLQADKLTVEIYADSRAMGEAAAEAAAQAMRHAANGASDLAVIFATGASQLDTLHALTSMPNLPWKQITGFHLDEYIGLPVEHPASFRGYLRKNLTERVSMKQFWEIDGTAPDLDTVRREYSKKLRQAAPQICMLGIGENGHLAFNDPGEADFRDPQDIKVVNLDLACREQQTGEGWFSSVDEVPAQALTVTISALLRVPKLIVSVPGSRKAKIIRRTLEEAISTECPATILRTHPDAVLYLDEESAAELDGLR